jgi:glycosyltransferase involved in cell wall biosynthesis
MPKPKVLHFFPDSHVFGGIQKYLTLVLPELTRNGRYDISIVCTDQSPMYHQLAAQGIRVYGIPFPLKKPSLLRSLFCKPLLRTINLYNHMQLARILRKENPDLVHVHDGRVENALIKKMGYPLVYTYHGYGHLYNLESAASAFHRSYYKLMRPLFQNMIPALDGMTIVSDYERRRILKEQFVPFDFPVELIYNGIHLDELRQRAAGTDKEEFRQSLNIPQDVKVVTFICRLVESKNVRAFLRLAERLIHDSRIRDPLYFLVAGSGPLASEFEAAFSENAALSNRGQFLGYRQDVPELLSISDLAVNTSLNEGFGLAVLEQITCACPFVAYAVGGISEVADSPGLSQSLVAADDEPALLNAAIQLLNLKEHDKKILCDNMVRQSEKFDISKTMRQLEAFYERMLTVSKN